MASSPSYKVYRSKASDSYTASCKENVAAAALALWYGGEACVRYRHKAILFTPAIDDPERELSWDQIDELMHERLDDYCKGQNKEQEKFLAKYTAKENENVGG